MSMPAICFGYCLAALLAGAVMLNKLRREAPFERRDGVVDGTDPKETAVSKGGDERAQSASLRDSLLQLKTSCLVIFVSLCNLKGSFFIATIDEQVRYLPASDSQKSSLLSCWYLALPIGGLCMALVAPLILKKAGSNHSRYFLVCLFLVALQAASNISLSLVSHYIAALLLGPSRTLLWACYFHFVGTVYPAEVVGRILGYSSLPIALISDLFPIMVAGSIDEHISAPFRIANIASTLLLGVCFVLPAHLIFDAP